MKLSAEEVFWIADERGFSREPVERMIRLYDVLESFAGDELMGPRMALVGGTALNAFHADLPRLSLDIDIHYMGRGGSVRIEEERPAFENQALRITEGKGYSLIQNPRSGTSGRWVFGYEDLQGVDAQLHVDVNYAQQPPFFGIDTLTSAPLGERRAREIPVVERSEVVGGKLSALLSREKARDLFDARTIAGMPDFDWPRVRVAALALGAADRRLDWRELSPSSINGNIEDIQGSLEPCLPAGHLDSFGGRQAWLDDTISTCRNALAPMFQLTDREKAFLGAVLDDGVADARHLDVDEETRRRIERRPTLQMRARIVREAQDRSRVAEERARQRPDTALRLACALTERIAPEGQSHWGNLLEGIEKLLVASDRRQDVSEHAVLQCAKGIARKRAEADLRVKATKKAGGELIHELEARFEGKPSLPIKEQKAYDAAVREGMEHLSGEDIRPDGLELAAARLLVTSEGTLRAGFTQDVAGSLEYGTVPEAEKIRSERAALPAELAKGTDGLKDFEKEELLQRLYRNFTVSELRELSLGKGPSKDPPQDQAAQTRAAETLKSLMSESVPGPAPWNKLHAALARSRGIERMTADSSIATPEVS
ncbi:MAG: nucleotidyl transferase AbiEii/AbiGii toxin family protein [Boseongicola sp. SB0675_bin_26]|nr:nucleotidyl transferase AbiEii/AbiGii toxin family protein [Boseongicola sp. SB0675_bin_26]